MEDLKQANNDLMKELSKHNIQPGNPNPPGNQVQTTSQEQQVVTSNPFQALRELEGENIHSLSDKANNEGLDNELASKSDGESHTTMSMGKRKYNRHTVPPSDRRTRAAEKQSISNPLN